MSRKKLQVLGTFWGIGPRIKKIRRDLSQEEFGKMLGVRKSTVSRYESGLLIPDLENLKKIADHGGVTVEWLLRGEEVRPALTEARPEPFETRPAELHSDYLVASIALARQYLRSARRKFTLHQEARLITSVYEHWQENLKPPNQTEIEHLAGLAAGKEKS